MDTCPWYHFHLPFSSDWNAHSNCIRTMLWLFSCSLFKVYFSSFVMFDNGKVVSVAYPLLGGPFYLAWRIWIAGHCHIVFCFTPWQIAFLGADVVFQYILLNLHSVDYSWSLSTFELVIHYLCYLLFPVVTYLSVRLPTPSHKLRSGILSVMCWKELLKLILSLSLCSGKVW